MAVQDLQRTARGENERVVEEGGEERRKAGELTDQPLAPFFESRRIAFHRPLKGKITLH